MERAAVVTAAAAAAAAAAVAAVEATVAVDAVEAVEVVAVTTRTYFSSPASFVASAADASPPSGGNAERRPILNATTAHTAVTSSRKARRNSAPMFSLRHSAK